MSDQMKCTWQNDGHNTCGETKKGPFCMRRMIRYDWIELDFWSEEPCPEDGCSWKTTKDIGDLFSCSCST